jgi:hypothetical protein
MGGGASQSVLASPPMEEVSGAVSDISRLVGIKECEK